MNTNERLFHLMAEKVYELCTDTPDFQPDDEDLSMMLGGIAVVANGMRKRSTYNESAACAIGFAAGELSNDMGYFINERGDQIDYMLDAMCKDGILEKLDGDEHTVYLRS